MLLRGVLRTPGTTPDHESVDEGHVDRAAPPAPVKPPPSDLLAARPQELSLLVHNLGILGRG
ncbi:MAG TPA: hypothetical protein VLP43_08770 [Solirubrobacteraceae bacterium]|nr:hypothetical protein [Solirubrobacteraceae bacterium]